MTTNQTQVPEKDQAFDDIKAKLPFDEADKKPEPPAPTPPPKVEEKLEDKKPEVTGDQPKTPTDDDKKENEGKKNPSRPAKYIPIDQYTDEKKRWNDTISEKDKKIEELQKIAEQTTGTKKFEDAVKQYAEKHDCDIEVAREEVEKVRDILDFTSSEPAKPEKKEEKPTLSEEQQKQLDEANEIRANAAFQNEFETALPQIKNLFPNATEAQLKAAKDELAKIACTEKYLDKDLDYIVFKEKDSLSDIFAATERKGPEPKKPSIREDKTALTATDFDDGKTDFSKLLDLSQEDRTKIVKNFSNKTWDKYMLWSQQHEELEVD